jgi:hypothetical protein
MGKPPKCGVENFVKNDQPVGCGLIKSMKKLFGRVRKTQMENNDHLKHRLMSNLSKVEKDALFELIVESRKADNWLMSQMSCKGDDGSHLSKEGTGHSGLS